MAGKKKRSLTYSGALYQLKITLQGSKPPIWRRVVVPAECNLETLHQVIQVAMGWQDDHLHAFEIDGENYDGRDPMGGRMEDMEGLDAAEYALCEVVNREKAKFTYQYDFGDSWDHSILVEKILPADATKGASRSPARPARRLPPRRLRRHLGLLPHARSARRSQARGIRGPQGMGRRD